MLKPWRVCSSNPARDFSNMSSTYHSAMLIGNSSASSPTARGLSARHATMAPGGISQRVPTITGMVTTLCAVADRPASIMKVAVRNDLDCDVRMGPHGLVPSYLYRYPEAAAGQADRRTRRPVDRAAGVEAT